uniref:P-type ATPase A domain-containing protein n=1 Tax=Arcella intermedia TaxID=1963864 RepID=A0A6B2KWT4_9EUKA
MWYSETKSDWVALEVKTLFGVPYFECEGERYYWNGHEYTRFNQKMNWTYQDILNSEKGMHPDKKIDPPAVGLNLIDIPVPTLLEDVLFAFFGPIQVYQYFCCAVWYIHGYPAFASMLIVSLLVSTSSVIYNNRKSRERLRQMAIHDTVMDVFREGEWSTVPSEQLYPGDLIRLPTEEFTCPCDLVIVSGTVLVDESFLTGESLPVVKTQPEDDKAIFDPEKDKKFSLYSSTKVMNGTPGNANSHVLALVSRTGFRTSKGQVVKAILHTKPYKYPYQQQSLIFLLILTFLGFVLFWIVLYIWGVFNPSIGLQTKEQIIYALEAIVCLVPPFLPIIFDITLLASAKNLENATIYTTNPSRIPIAGKVRTMCFDKTGTLTKTDLDVIGVVTLHSDGLRGEPTSVTSLHEDDELMEGLSTCHSLAALGDIIDVTAAQNTLGYSGPKLDVQMFGSTGWRYYQGSGNQPSRVVSSSKKTIEILKRFDFDNNLQRMSVIARHSNGRCYAYVKGSGESIASICDPSSIPPNYDEMLRKFSKDGCYVIAFASKPIDQLDESDLAEIDRDYVDRKLKFNGLLLLRNELKMDSKQAIDHIIKGRIRPVMITGDNILTAFYIAKRCGLVSPSNPCFSGTYDEKEKSVVFRDINNQDVLLDIYNWKVYSKKSASFEDVTPSNLNIGVDNTAYRELMGKYDQFLVKNVQIFARMRPLDKQDVIDLMMQNGDIVGMCGDGANDCCALNKAHFGVALSAAEASLIAPFTAQSLSAVACVDLIKEGRASLASSFAAFKLTLFHAIVVNTTAMFISFTFGSDLSQAEYFITDFIFFFFPVFFIVRTKPADKLLGNPPTSKIFGPTTMFSFLFQVAISWIGEGVIIALLKQQSWFTPNPVGTVAKYNIPESTTLFLLAILLLGAVGVTNSFGATWRQPIWRNYGLIVIWLLQIATIIFVYIAPHQSDMHNLASIMDMVPIPGDFRLQIAILGLTIAILIIAYEKVVIIGPVSQYFRKKFNIGRVIRSPLNPIWENDFVDQQQ